MKVCPYCNTHFPSPDTRCPNCGRSYWDPNQYKDPTLLPPTPEKEEKEGCFTIFLIPILTAIAVASGLILIGFLFDTLVHFERNQVKVIWILVSIGIGVGISRLVTQLKKKSKKEDKP